MQTTTLPFFPCNAAQQNLFAVVPGVADHDALECVSCLLDAVRTCAYERQGSDNLSSAAAYLTEMVKAVVDSLARPREAKPDDCALANVFDRLAALRENGVLIIAPTVSSFERDDAEGFLRWAAEQAKGCQRSPQWIHLRIGV